MTSSAPAPPKHQSLLRAGQLGALGWVLAIGAAWAFLEGVSHANKPHEIENQWVVMVLAGLDLLLAIVVPVLLVRNIRRDGL